MKRITSCAHIVLAVSLSAVLPCNAATINWTNTAGGNWGIPLNWSPNQVPGPADTAVLPDVGNSYAVTLNVTASVSGLLVGATSGANTQAFSTGSQTLTVNGIIQVNPQGAFNFDGGNLAGTNVLGGTVNWSAGTSQGVMTVSNNGVLNINGGFTVEGALTNAGTVNWLSGRITLYGCDNAGPVVNLPGGTWNIQCDQFMENGTCAITPSENFQNFGTVEKTASTALTTFNIPFNNSGAVNAVEGTIDFNGGGTLGGDFSAASSTIIEFAGGAFSYTAVPTLTGPGTIELNGGSLTLASNVIPNLQIAGGTLSLASTFQGGAITNLTVGAATLSGNYTVSGTFNWNGTTVAGGLVVTGGGIVNWSAGALQGVMTVNNNGVLNLSGGIDLNGTLTNAGTVNWFSGLIDLDGCNQAGPIVNLAGGTWNIQCNQIMQNGMCSLVASEYFENFGTVEKTASTGISTFDIPFNNAGAVSAIEGTINFNAGGIIGDDYYAAGNAIIEFAGGAFTYTTAPILTGTGVTELNGGSLTLVSNEIPNFQVSGGTLSLGSNFQGGTITNLTVGAATLSGNYAVNGTFNWNGTTVSGSLAVAAGGVVNWSVGTLQGDMTVSSNAVLNIGGGIDLNGVLTNAGTVNWLSGLIDLDGCNQAGPIVNLAGGTWNIQCNQIMQNGMCSLVASEYFENFGTVEKTASTGISTFDIPFNNAGAVSAIEGTINFNAGGIIGDDYNAAGNAIIEFAGGAFTYTTAPILTGTGVTELNGGSLTLLSNVIPNLQIAGGMLALGPNFQGGDITNLTVGAATLSGNYTVNGTFNWEGTTVVGNILVLGGSVVNWSAGNLQGGMTVGYGGTVNLSGGIELSGALTNAGTVNWLSDAINLNGCDHAGPIVNLAGAVWNIQCNYPMENGYCSATASGYFQNFGTVEKTATTGVTTFTIPFTNSGLLDAQAGTMVLNTNSLAGGTLNFGISSLISYGVISIPGSPVLTGAISANLNNNYVPTAGATFKVLTFTSSTGEFTSTNLPPVAIWQTTYNPANVTLTVLKLAPPPAPVLTILHSFDNSDGANPASGLTALGNTLFGTTSAGGTNNDGVVFSINTDGSEFMVLHSFYGGDGDAIEANLVVAGDTLYGAASEGGDYGDGTLFSLSTDGTSFTTLFAFSSSLDGIGGYPEQGLLLSGSFLYGSAFGGSGTSSNGTIFSKETNGEQQNFITLHIFNGADGSNPHGDLALGDNVLYGTTYQGGASNQGVVFSIQTNGSNFTLLHSFSKSDGEYPTTTGLVLSNGILYGTTEAFGPGTNGAGTVFSVQTNGSNFTVLHTFTTGTNGGVGPFAGLFLSDNVLYGTTQGGGAGLSGGTVFSIGIDGSNYKQLYSPSDSIEGYYLSAPVILLGNSLYGTAYRGGSNGVGTVFGLQISGIVFTLEPVGRTNVAIGASAVFTAAGMSLSLPTATIQYQWRLNGAIIPGATTAELIFQDVQPTDGGNLTVTISDGVNSATSEAVGFSVAVPTIASGNTNFGNRFILSEAPSSVVGSSNTDGAPEAGEPQIIPGNPGGKPIWFEWQPTNSGTAVFTTLGSDFDTILGVYSGTNISALTRVPSCVNDDDSGGFLTSKVEFNCVAGTAYEIVVDGYWGASGNVVLSWVTEDYSEPLPSLLVVPPRQMVASNGAAVTLVCQSDSGVPMWFFDGLPTGVTGPDFPIIAVGDGNVGTYVAETTLGGGVASTQPAHLQFNVLDDGTSDPNSIAWNKFLDSVNSAYSNPAQSSIHKLGGGDTRGYSVSQTFSTVGALSEPGEPSIAGQIGGSPYWYTYVTPTNGALLINTAGSSFNTLLGAFIGSGKSFATITNVGASFTTNRFLNGQPQVYIPTAPKGQTNFIVVDGYNGASGTVQLNIDIGNPVVIATPPQNQSVPAGSNVTFTVDAGGSTPLSYLWQFNGTNIAGATNNNLTVSNVQPANFGVYTIVISNLVSSTSASAMLSPLNPLQLSAPLFTNGKFQLQLTGTAGGSYVIQTSTNLETWTPVITNIATNGFFLLTDTNASNFDRHFYRGVAN